MIHLQQGLGDLALELRFVVDRCARSSAQAPLSSSRDGRQVIAAVAHNLLHDGVG